MLRRLLVVFSAVWLLAACASEPPPPPPPQPAAVAPPSFMVFFDWDRSNLSQQALVTIKQAADAFKTRGSAQITATGHTDTSGPEAYNMALSLRRANAVKDALAREGVPAPAITVVGKGETQLLVPTGDGVREPQNRYPRSGSDRQVRGRRLPGRYPDARECPDCQQDPAPGARLPLARQARLAALSDCLRRGGKRQRLPPL